MGPSLSQSSRDLTSTWPASVQWAAWVAAGLALDLLAWSVLSRIRVLAANPGSASALALCWVHPFVLPSLFARPFRGGRNMLIGAASGLLGAPIALLAGALTGLQAGMLAFLLLAAISPPAGESVVHQAPGPALRVILDVLSGVVLWGGFMTGSAMAGLVATGLAVFVPSLPRPRMSWRVPVAGACAAVVLLPDWLFRWLQPPWREPLMLLAAALPGLVLVNWRRMTRTEPN